MFGRISLTQQTIPSNIEACIDDLFL